MMTAAIAKGHGNYPVIINYASSFASTNQVNLRNIFVCCGMSNFNHFDADVSANANRPGNSYQYNNSYALLSSNPITSFLNRIDDSDLNCCMKSIVADIKKLSNGSVAGIIQKFASGTPGYNWKMKDARLSLHKNGETHLAYKRATGTVTTLFDSRKLRDASDLCIAAIILHESVHAYLVAYFENEGRFPDGGAFAKTYPALFKIYAHDWRNINIHQHTQMVQSFIADIANALQEFGRKRGYNLPGQYYQDMVWGGLTSDSDYQPTILFLQLVPDSADRERILNRLSSEQSGYDLNGWPAQQSGTIGGC